MLRIAPSSAPSVSFSGRVSVSRSSFSRNSGVCRAGLANEAALQREVEQMRDQLAREREMTGRITKSLKTLKEELHAKDREIKKLNSTMNVLKNERDRILKEMKDSLEYMLREMRQPLLDLDLDIPAFGPVSSAAPHASPAPHQMVRDDQVADAMAALAQNQSSREVPKVSARI